MRKTEYVVHASSKTDAAYMLMTDFDKVALLTGWIIITFAGIIAVWILAEKLGRVKDKISRIDEMEERLEELEGDAE